MSPKKLKPQKVALIDLLKQLLADSKSVAVVDYKGLKVSQATELRRAIKKAGGQIIVTKNSLFSLALTTHNPRLTTNLTGPSAFIFSHTDEISAIRAVADFAKKNTIPTFKMGLLSNRLLSVSEVTTLATLPTKDILITQMLGSLNSPLYRLVASLNWNLSRLVITLDTIKQRKAG